MWQWYKILNNDFKGWVFTSGENSGSVLHKQIQEVLTNVKFDTDWLVGQSVSTKMVGQNEPYDWADNMRGKYSGLATRFQKTCKKAVYVWCNAHRLNLGMNSVTTYCQDIKHNLGLLEDVAYVLFDGFIISWTRHEQVENNENRLRTSLADEKMSAPMILAAERDLCSN